MNEQSPSQGERALQHLLDATGLIIMYPPGPYERLAVLQVLCARMTVGRTYTEQEINEFVQQHVHPSAADHVTVRRDLVDYQLIHRTDSGARYWRDEAGVGTLPIVRIEPGTVSPDHVADEPTTTE